MQVTIKGQPQELYVQTVTLQPEEGQNMYGFHCPNCGNFLQQVGGKVSKIYPFHEPNDQVTTVVRCKYCKNDYTFQTHDGYSTEKITVMLHADPKREKNHLYCYRGKHRILEYSKGHIYSLIDEEEKTPPFITPCSDPLCPLFYLITAIV